METKAYYRGFLGIGGAYKHYLRGKGKGVKDDRKTITVMFNEL